MRLMQLHSTSYLREELERAEISIALCHIETGWTKDLRTYKNNLIAELEHRKEEAES